MSEFEDFIKAKYPVDYESLKEKYPNVPIVEFYGDEQDVWDHQQSKIEQLEKEKAELQGRIRKATSKWIVVTSIATTQESGLPDTFYQKLEELRDALVGFKEATRGECEQ